MRELYEILLQDGIAQPMAEKMAKYGEMVVKANEKFNLTRITSPQDMAESHLSIQLMRREEDIFLKMRTLLISEPVQVFLEYHLQFFYLKHM